MKDIDLIFSEERSRQYSLGGGDQFVFDTLVLISERRNRRRGSILFAIILAFATAFISLQLWSLELPLAMNMLSSLETWIINSPNIVAFINLAFVALVLSLRKIHFS